MASDRTPRMDWDAARQYAFAVATALDPISIPLAKAVGRTTATDVVARCDVPHYASSAMDGWAVSGPSPWRLRMGGASTAGVTTIAPGEAIPIVTGGLIPLGVDRVLRSEHGVQAGSTLDRNTDAPTGEPQPGEHIRPVAEEARMSETVIRSGAVLNPANIAVAAVSGHDELSVLPRPRVSLVLTGNEVIEHGIPAPGKVRDTFGPQLPSLIRMLGGEVTAEQHLADDLDLLVAALREHADTELIITTGGTGTSPADHLRSALTAVGAKMLIDGIRMRPGGPTLLAKLPDGRFLIGLPGNPLAAMMGVLTLVRPLLAGMAGDSEPDLGSVLTARELPGRPGIVQLLPYASENGAAITSRWFGSGMLRGLAEADGVLITPPAGARPGEIVQTLPLPW